MPSKSDSDKYTRERIPNKVQWALQDIITRCMDTNEDIDEAAKIAERQMDIASLATLRRVTRNIADIQVIAVKALEGKYNGEKES